MIFLIGTHQKQKIMGEKLLLSVTLVEPIKSSTYNDSCRCFFVVIALSGTLVVLLFFATTSIKRPPLKYRLKRFLLHVPVIVPWAYNHLMVVFTIATTDRQGSSCRLALSGCLNADDIIVSIFGGFTCLCVSFILFPLFTGAVNYKSIIEGSFYFKNT